ncbi:MAG: hypothetical protein AB1696_23835 [Planctomycetota bacterium]
MEQAPQQPKKLLVAILVSSLVTNVILLGVTGASLYLVYELNKEVAKLQQRLDEVRQIVDTIKAAGGAVRDRIQERRQGQAEEGEQGGQAAPAPTEDSSPRGPLKRLRGKTGDK